MTSVKITVEPLPDGFRLFRAKKWPLVEIGLSFETFGGSSFQVVPLWIPETRQFSAISNFSILDTDGTLRLQKLQPQDSYGLRVKMNWLVGAGTSTPECAMWTDSTLEWNVAPQYHVGTMLWGDQTFLASKTVEMIRTTPTLGTIPCRRVYAFRRSDWSKDPATHPHLFPRATVCRPSGGISDDFGRGEIRTMLQVLDPRDYKFAGTITPSFYIPDFWCLPL